MRTRTPQETERALVDVAEKLEFLMAQKGNRAGELFAALLEMHGLWRGKPFSVTGERTKRGVEP